MKPHALKSLVLLALLALGCATPFENRRWVAIETEHFQFLTDDDEARSVQLARDFEVFHSFMEHKRMITAKSVNEWSPLEISQLYATGWFLVHYFYTSAREGKENRWAQKDAFLARLNQSGHGSRGGVQDLVPVDFRQMERELAGYLKDLSALQIPIERFGPVAEPRVRVVQGAETLTRLAELQVVGGGDPRRGARLLERALEIDPQQPRARALLGRTLGAQERHDEAEAMFARALEQEPDSALTHLDHGLYLASRAIRRNRESLTFEPICPPSSAPRT